MDEGSTVGEMAGDMKGSTNLTRNMGLAPIHGLMGGNMWVSGSTANVMEEVEL